MLLQKATLTYVKIHVTVVFCIYYFHLVISISHFSLLTPHTSLSSLKNLFSLPFFSTITAIKIVVEATTKRLFLLIRPKLGRPRRQRPNPYKKWKLLGCWASSSTANEGGFGFKFWRFKVDRIPGVGLGFEFEDLGLGFEDVAFNEQWIWVSEFGFG